MSIKNSMIIMVGLVALVFPLSAYAGDSNVSHRKYITYIKSFIGTKCNQSSKCELTFADEKDGHIFITMKDGGDKFSNDIILIDVAVALNRMNKMAIHEGIYEVARWFDVTLSIGKARYFFDKPLFVQFRRGKINDSQFAKLARKKH